MNASPSPHQGVSAREQASVCASSALSSRQQAEDMRGALGLAPRQRPRPLPENQLALPDRNDLPSQMRMPSRAPISATRGGRPVSGTFRRLLDDCRTRDPRPSRQQVGFSILFFLVAKTTSYFGRAGPAFPEAWLAERPTSRTAPGMPYGELRAGEYPSRLP